MNVAAVAASETVAESAPPLLGAELPTKEELETARVAAATAPPSAPAVVALTTLSAKVTSAPRTAPPRPAAETFEKVLAETERAPPGEKMAPPPPPCVRQGIARPQ